MSKNTRARDEALTLAFQRQLERSGLPRIRWHALRRVFAAALQDQGVSLAHIRDLMGHAELRVTEGYAYRMPGSLAASMKALDAFFASSIGASEQTAPRD